LISGEPRLNHGVTRGYQGVALFSIFRQQFLLKMLHGTPRKNPRNSVVKKESYFWKKVYFFVILITGKNKEEVNYF
jgi:hypothetical protein